MAIERSMTGNAGMSRPCRDPHVPGDTTALSQGSWRGNFAVNGGMRRGNAVPVEQGIGGRVSATGERV